MNNFSPAALDLHYQLIALGIEGTAQRIEAMRTALQHAREMIAGIRQIDIESSTIGGMAMLDPLAKADIERFDVMLAEIDAAVKL